MKYFWKIRKIVSVGNEIRMVLVMSNGYCIENLFFKNVIFIGSVNIF